MHYEQINRHHEKVDLYEVWLPWPSLSVRPVRPVRRRFVRPVVAVSIRPSRPSRPIRGRRCTLSVRPSVRSTVVVLYPSI